MRAAKTKNCCVNVSVSPRERSKKEEEARIKIVGFCRKNKRTKLCPLYLTKPDNDHSFVNRQKFVVVFCVFDFPNSKME
jgi:hypothetical protein